MGSPQSQNDGFKLIAQSLLNILLGLHMYQAQLAIFVSYDSKTRPSAIYNGNSPPFFTVRLVMVTTKDPNDSEARNRIKKCVFSLFRDFQVFLLVDCPPTGKGARHVEMEDENDFFSRTRTLQLLMKPRNCFGIGIKMQENEVDAFELKGVFQIPMDLFDEVVDWLVEIRPRNVLVMIPRHEVNWDFLRDWFVVFLKKWAVLVFCLVFFGENPRTICPMLSHISSQNAELNLGSGGQLTD